MKISLKLFSFFVISIGLVLCGLSVPGVTAQTRIAGPDSILSSFVRPEIYQKNGQLGFNIVKIKNLSGSDVSIKPIFVLPDDWAMFSSFFKDTLIAQNDSISLPLRYRPSARASAEKGHDVFFRAYSPRNELLTEASFIVFPEAEHNWDVTLEQNRVFFYPKMQQARFNVVISNQSNVHEDITLFLQSDKRVDLEGEEEWVNGKVMSLPPFHDTIIPLLVRYSAEEDRIFDVGKVTVIAQAGGKELKRIVMAEKYNDIYAPLFVDRALPHQAEAGIRTFSGNDKFLPFVKARGFSSFKNKSTFMYNFNYYSMTEEEDFIGNSYYNFLYHWKTLKVGLGAFSSQYGRNLYTRNGIMVSNVVNLTSSFSLEAFVSQSIIDPKTSAAVGYAFKIKEIKFNGSLAYDRDLDRGLNTTSAIFQTGRMEIFKNHNVSASLYGYRENHYRTKSYTLQGIAYDLHYYARIGNSFTLLVTNNYGSPDIPGPQMGLFNISTDLTYAIENQERYFSVKYAYATRRYYNITFEGTRLPNIDLYDQYVNLKFHSNRNDNHMWEAGPSVEFYRSRRPTQIEGIFTEYNAQKIRFEYKSTIAKSLTLNVKAGVSDISVREATEISERRYDIHVLGGYSLVGGYGLSFSYDYGPMVNTGLYQYAGDALNHSVTMGPSMMSTFWNGRINFNLFANFIYRFDIQHGSININPKVEAYLYRDWYAVVSGTYHYTRQEYPDYTARNSYAYAEFSIKKRWGKTDFNKWQKDTRRLKIILFQDDNANGIRDYGEQGIPFVKTRLKLTNSASPNISTQFPVDIVLLSNEEGVVIYNRLPVGFYDLTIFPLGDVREYFYVDRGAEKLELTKTSVYYIPFQKASRLIGKINLKRGQFIKQGEEIIDLSNIRVTAYNKMGNSYSSLTLEDGSFTIFVPGNNEYYVRMTNVFGDNFKIPNNDMAIWVSDTTQNTVTFNVVESTRQINFKKAKPAEPDTVAKPLKIKVLHGKIYENQPQDTVDVNAIPEFSIQFAPPDEQVLITGNYYVVSGELMDRPDALKYHRILKENGVKSYLGLDEPSGKYYVFTNYYQSQETARKEMDRLKKAGLKDVRVIKYE